MAGRPPKDLTTKIAVKMEALGVTRNELCEATGVSYRTLEAWLRRDRIPRDVYALKNLADAFNKVIDRKKKDNEQVPFDIVRIEDLIEET